MTDNLVNYQGSRLLSGLSSYTSLNVDHLNFIVSQLVALGLAGLYRTVLGPTKVSPQVRHLFGLFFGMWMAFFCFGYQALHLAVLPAICYLVILTQNPSILHGAVLFTALFYLSMVHLHRQFFEDTSYGLDISGPLMVVTQKVTSLAFSLHDGLMKKEEDLTETQKYYAVRKMPSLLEYFSYSLMFPTLMAGPMIFYKDYIEFINGHPSTTNNIKSTSNQVVFHEPSPLRAICKKVILAIICALIFVLFLPKFPISRVKEQNFIENTSFGYKFWYLTVVTSLVRAKYYFAWTLADAISNNAGLGWDGETWNKYSNVDIFHFEFGTSLKESIDAWNKGTNRWLRFIVYKRFTTYPLVATFLLSAIWHGFHPGYYLTFLSGALFTFSSRTMRRHLRPHFLNSNESKLLYDILTFAVTRFVMAYVTFTFVLLEFSASVTVYNKLYWVWHILAVLALLLAPRVISKPNFIEVGQKNSITMALSKAGPYSDAVGKID
ncbi:lysophospholipid acyltransferase 6 [Anthonomus grandis grandis]|uniref:lysophospholipid acyltransferase 6 n=1 Tax=Anthonomus grandis grandis TaxID=2921223 RepID=UPI0021654462|nr:lysophospholipid acyltransferase 6 [Anthonomus grandis grandis]